MGSFALQELEELPRRELQALAKKHGLKANAKVRRKDVERRGREMRMKQRCCYRVGHLV
jgi:hypothetical protein